MQDREEEEKVEDTNAQLRFISNTNNLRQVFVREPGDGLFPVVKHIDAIEAEDVEPLVKANLNDILKKVIKRD